VQCFKNESTQIATLKFALHSTEEIQNPNAVKVVTDRNGHALYFSRSPIPFRRNQDMEVAYFRHVGIYAFRPTVLQAITQLAMGNLEEIEMLEQLRWLENGYKIQVAETDFISPAVDTPEDLMAALEFLKDR
jgi:3-deoxy-manno-octulosonate cytidylyltransferase (CMP-KDO synthetase)